MNHTSTPKIRTNKQSNSMHLFCHLLADELNLAGLTQKTVLAHWVDIEWSKENVKELLWKPILKAYSVKDSTKEMDTKEPSMIWDTLNRFFGEHFEMDIPMFPSESQTKNYIDSLK